MKGAFGVERQQIDSSCKYLLQYECREMVSWIWDKKFNQEELESQWRREYEDGFFFNCFVLPITNNAIFSAKWN